MELGKINKEVVEQLFQKKQGNPTKNLIQGPAFGVDTGIIRIDEQKSLVIASDPASYIPSLGMKDSAWLTVILAANDVATSGSLPEYAQFVLNLPNHISAEDFSAYWNYIHYYCLENGISITGGHTGFDDNGNSTLAGGTTMFSIVDTSTVKSSSHGKPSQDIIITKSAALSSAALLAKSFPNYVKEKLGHQTYNALANSFEQISILSEIKVLRQNTEVFNQISAFHDVTEGGILGAVYEFSVASGVGVKIDEEKIHVGDEQKQICKLFNIDSFRCIGAGSLLIACDKEVSEEIVNLLREHHIVAKKIGETLGIQEGRKIQRGAEQKELEYQEKDPYWEAYFAAMKQGLN